ncbi:MAG: PAS domain S-box protein [Mojavia pulchra JT2-VF2]|jgi:PAS domain S-box-containing protein|uniref:histidine kinase n=1 Tax=Mojavia pulchra JT2-VF2 TaxID=287848 RepID=A0A951PZP6_9NOST|nr:PAS domain S-box protein [Mojavia pulchra JT2-VF2]
MNAKIYLQFSAYVVAVGSVAIALLLTLLLQPLLTTSIASLFFVAVALTTWYGGIKPGLITTVLSVIAINYFLITPVHHFTPASWSDALRLGLFFLNASIINLLGNDLRKNKHQVEQLSQQLLQESAIQLSLALSATRMGMWNWNIQTGKINWSPEHERLFGLAPGTFDGRYETFDRCLHPEDREALNQAVNRAIQEQIAYQHEYRIVWADGSVHWIEGRGQTFYDETGEPVRMMGTVMDISERKEAEAALARSEQHLRTIIDAEPECVKVISADGILLNMNAAGLAMIEADSLAQVVGQCVYPFIAPSHRQAFRDFIQQVAQGDSSVLDFEIIGLKGTRRWVESHAVPLREPKESGNRVLAVTRDITERKQADIALRESEQRYASLAAAVPVGIFRIDVEGNCLYVNDRWCQLTGLTPDQAKETGWLQTLHPTDRERVIQDWNHATQNQQMFYSEFRFLRADGVVNWVYGQAVVERAVSGEVSGYVGTITDISGRKQREEQLRLLESVILKTNDAVLIVEAEPIDPSVRRIVYANPAFTKMSGYALEEVIGKTFHILQGKKTDQAVLAKINLALETWQSIRCDLINYRKDGSEFWVDLSIVPVADEEGEYTHWVAVQRDITERKRAEEELETRVTQRTAELSQANSRLQYLVSSCPSVIFSCKPCGDYGITYISENVFSLLGYEPQEFLEKSHFWVERVHPEDVERVFTDMVRVDEQHFYSHDYRFQRADGTYCWLLVQMRLIRDVSGKPTEILGYLVDISDVYDELRLRKQAEEALRESEAKFRSLSEYSPIGIFMTDAQGKTTYTNPRAQEIGGYTFEEALGYGWLQSIHPEDQEQIYTQWSAAISNQQRFAHDELRYLHKDGTVRYGKVQTAPILAAKGQFLAHVGTIEDVTESRAIAQMKNEFISIVSHELRTPLTAIRGSLGLLAAGVYDKKPDKGKRMLQIAADQTDRLVRLVNDILDLGRLESGKVRLEMQICDAAKLIQQSVDAMRANAEQNHIALSVSSSFIQVWADPDSIIQTLTNLLSNAIKFSPPNTHIWLSAEQVCENGQSSTSIPHVLFQIKDEGRGIPHEKIEAIFERFQQVDASDSRQKGGTGLGLAICRRIIQQHGGHIWAESILGKGSTFYFTLPIAIA